MSFCVCASFQKLSPFLLLFVAISWSLFQLSASLVFEMPEKVHKAFSSYVFLTPSMVGSGGKVGPGGDGGKAQSSLVRHHCNVHWEAWRWAEMSSPLKAGEKIGEFYGAGA